MIGSSQKGPCKHNAAVLAVTASPAAGGLSLEMEGFPLPDNIVLSEILGRLDLPSLCSLSCASKLLYSLVSQALSSLPSLDLTAFSPTEEILENVVRRFIRLRSATVDCLRLEDVSMLTGLGPHIEELNLLKCALLPLNVLESIREYCRNLRVLTLELAERRTPEIFKEILVEMLGRLLFLESLTIKGRGAEFDGYPSSCFNITLPRTLKRLKLQPVHEEDAIELIQKTRDERLVPNLISPTCHSPCMLTHLSLILNILSDELITLVAASLPLLVELDLEDRPWSEPRLPSDLTNNGLQSLGNCHYLTSLSIVRNRLYLPASFKRINDLGMFLLSESCRGLESVTLGGFSTVTDAGFSSIIQSCHNLKKFEVRNAPLLSDLAFHDINGVGCPLVESRILSCNLITDEAVEELASSCALEMLNTYGCRSISDSCLDYISRLSTLTSLNIGGADVTDTGLAILGKGALPISHLCLRGCTRVTDRGILCLLNCGETIKKTLSYLDIGHMPGISDKGIHEIVSNAEAIKELCMRSCFHVTDASLEMLALKRSNGCNLLEKLDLAHCLHLSSRLVGLMNTSSFRGLRWLGLGGTSLVDGRDDFDLICMGRPWLTICFEGCEVGCHDGWQFHKSNAI